MEKENGRTGIQILIRSYPFYGRVLRDKDEKPRKIDSPSVPSRNSKKSKKGSKKRKALTSDDSEDEDSDQGKKARSFASTTARADIPLINTPRLRQWSSRQNRKEANNLSKRKGSPSME